MGVTMKWSDFLMVLAILLAPLVAIQVSRFLDKQKEIRQRKLQIFQTLMATRATRLSPIHIQALNMIDLEFYGNDKNSKEVVEAWKVYLDHLNNKKLLESSVDSWSSKGDDLFIDLLQKMAKCLDYDLEKTSIKTTSYFPAGHGQIEDEQTIIRRGLTALFLGKYALPVILVPPRPETHQESHKEQTG